MSKEHSQQHFLPALVGSMSQGAAGNPTVAMVEAAFAHHGLHWRYINMEVTPDGLGSAVLGAKAMGFRGFNCSIPHKVAVIPYLDGLGQSAEVMGAVNCVVRRGDLLIGENTDGKGFLKSLREVVDPSGRSVVLFGAGGAARAIAVELGLAGAARITIVNRSESHGTALVLLLQEKLRLNAQLSVWRGDFAVPRGTDIVINATSIGLYDATARVPVNADTLFPGMVVADVIFNPPTTAFLREALERGCQTIDGLGMLVNQGVIGVQYWTGLEPDPAVMRAKIEEIFRNPESS